MNLPKTHGASRASSTNQPPAKFLKQTTSIYLVSPATGRSEFVIGKHLAPYPTSHTSHLWAVGRARKERGQPELMDGQQI